MRHILFVAALLAMLLSLAGASQALDPGQLTGTTGYSFAEPIKVPGLPANVSAFAAGRYPMASVGGQLAWLTVGGQDGQNRTYSLRANFSLVWSGPTAGLKGAGVIAQFAQGQLDGRLLTLATSAKGVYSTVFPPLPVFRQILPAGAERLFIGQNKIYGLFRQSSTVSAGFYELVFSWYGRCSLRAIRLLPLEAANDLQITANGTAYFQGNVGGRVGNWVVDANGYHERADPFNEPRIFIFTDGSFFQDYNGSPGLYTAANGDVYDTYTEIGPYDGVLPLLGSNFLAWEQVYNVLTPVPQWETWLSWWQNGAYSKSQIFIASETPQVGRRLSSLLPFGNLAFGNFEGQIYALPVVRDVPLHQGYFAIF